MNRRARWPPRPRLLISANAWRVWIAKRTGGRIRRLSVETRDDRILIRGSRDRSTPVNWRQAAVQEVLDVCHGLPLRFVEYGIDIGDGESARFQDMRANSRPHG